MEKKRKEGHAIPPCSGTTTIRCVGKSSPGSRRRKRGRRPRHSTPVGSSLHEATSAVGRRGGVTLIESGRTLLGTSSLCDDTFVVVSTPFYSRRSLRHPTHSHPSAGIPSFAPLHGHHLHRCRRPLSTSLAGALAASALYPLAHHALTSPRPRPLRVTTTVRFSPAWPRPAGRPPHDTGSFSLMLSAALHRSMARGGRCDWDIFTPGHQHFSDSYALPVHFWTTLPRHVSHCHLLRT